MRRAVVKRGSLGGNGVVKQVLRVAIYTRKSVTEGLDQEFNTLDAQREAVEAYVQSQRAEGWEALPERYDDGGFTGANVERPAFQRLLHDIDLGRVDVVAVHRIDRLSRSLLDFTRLMEMFRQHGVTFVSVTQQFSTTTSVGRMTLNLLATFAEFERELISERTKAKILATRQRGAWTGGRPVIGYDVVNKKLIVNEAEAEQVRATFQLYRRLGSLLPVVKELNLRDWTNKTWTNSSGGLVEGGRFNKTTLYHLLTNPLYAGRIRAGDEIVEAEHQAIVSPEEFDAVQQQLTLNAGLKRRPKKVGGQNGTILLAGLLKCARCGRSMTHHYTAKKQQRYNYYVCLGQQKLGAKSCPGGRVPAGRLEQFVVDQIRGVGRDPALLEATLEAAQKDRTAEREAFEARLQALAKDRAKLDRERERLVLAVGNGRSAVLKRLDVVEAGIAKLDQEADEVRLDLAAIDGGTVDPEALAAVLAELEPLWNELFPRERARLLALLVESVEFDADSGEVALTFRPGGPQAVRGERDHDRGGEA